MKNQEAPKKSKSNTYRKNSQSRGCGTIKNKQKRDGPGNRFQALAQFENEGSVVASAVSPRPLIFDKEKDETPPPPAITVTKAPNPTEYAVDEGAALTANLVWTPRSGRKVIEEALCVREDLMSLLRNKSIDKKSNDLFRTERFNLESEIQEYSICPDHLLSEKMAIVEARIRKMKGLSPVKGQAVVGAEVSEVPPLGKGGTIVPSLPLAMAIPESTEGGSIEPNVREVSTGEDVVYSVEEISDKDNSERLSDEAVDKAHGVREASGKENKRLQAVEVVRKCDDFVPHPVSPGGSDELCRPCMGNAAEDKTDDASMQPHETKSWADIVASNGLTVDPK
ncbi:hypothetical protein U1Q18_036584, partial [Sarracenia purpurea var. burkii]